MFFILFLLLGTSNGLLNSKPNNNINKNNIIKLAETNFKLVPYFAKSYIYKHKLNTFEKQELIQEIYLLRKECLKIPKDSQIKAHRINLPGNLSLQPNQILLNL